jgi:hypothetical protein
MIVDCGCACLPRAGIADFKFRIPNSEFPNKFWMAQRMIMNRMPSSIRENAQSSIEPKAMGVKIRRRIRVNLMALLSIAGLCDLPPLV